MTQTSGIQTMIDADLIRETLIHGPPYAESDDNTALVALDALLAERDALAEQLAREIELRIDDEPRAVERTATQLARCRDDLIELARCVMDGWTEPAFVRGPLHERAVEIARAALDTPPVE